MEAVCSECGVALDPCRSRRPARFCSGRCRQKAYRRRRRTEFPVALREGRRWVRADGKRPIMADGRPASSINPRTWANFGDVQVGAGDGFGVMLGGGIGCIDLDGALDGRGRVVSPVARAVLDANPGAWAEVSVSGLGLHVFGLLRDGPGSCRDGVEVYSRSRFIRVTGNVFRPGGLVPLVVPS